MKLLAIFATLSAWVVLNSVAANAATIINRDQQSYQIRIVEGDEIRDLTLDPEQQVDGVCNSACSLVLGDDPEPYEIVATESFEIIEGHLSFSEGLPQTLDEQPIEDEQQNQ